ncbi:MAG: hypothetical protein DRJ28_00780 [Actinobacteria bacterium]|nr:MAG: hypothetical protein DRJ28_00780 [Actinomycetota bacterium]
MDRLAILLPEASRHPDWQSTVAHIQNAFVLRFGRVVTVSIGVPNADAFPHRRYSAWSLIE